MSDPAIEAAQRAWNTEGWGCNPLAMSEGNLAVAAAREALAPLRELHKSRRGMCDTCVNPECAEEPMPWPCDTARLIYPSEEL